MAKKPEAILTLPVTFGGFGASDRTCRISVAVSRANYTPSKADRQLVDKRLTCTLRAVPAGANGDQASLPGLDNDRTVKAIGDCRGYSANGKRLSFSLSFLVASVDAESLMHFPKHDGELIVTGVEELPEGGEEDEGDE